MIPTLTDRLRRARKLLHQRAFAARCTAERTRYLDRRAKATGRAEAYEIAARLFLDVERSLR
jgi:hypothetical protein